MRADIEFCASFKYVGHDLLQYLTSCLDVYVVAVRGEQRELYSTKLSKSLYNDVRGLPVLWSVSDWVAMHERILTSWSSFSPWTWHTLVVIKLTIARVCNFREIKSVSENL